MRRNGQVGHPLGAASTLGRVAPQLTDGVIVLSALTVEDAAALVAGEDADIAARLAR